VAGEGDTTVEAGGGNLELRAEPILYDPQVDIAILRVRTLQVPTLTLASSATAGASGAILGYPENGAFDAEPARIGHTQPVETQNAYGEGPVTRLLTPLRGLVRPGNSGGPVVDGRGHVLTTVFAST